MFKRNWGWALAGLAFLLAGAVDHGGCGRCGDCRGRPARNRRVDRRCNHQRAATDAGQRSTLSASCCWSSPPSSSRARRVVSALPILAAAFQSGWLLPLAFPLAGLVLVISAFVWISAPTREGRAVLDRIMGFRQYLSITERDRLDRLTAPEDTPELFERYLPYAIALGVENRWADRFSGVLASASVAGHSGFGWYSGSGSPWNDARASPAASARRWPARSPRRRRRPARRVGRRRIVGRRRRRRRWRRLVSYRDRFRTAVGSF